MNSDFRVILDACVLVQAATGDSKKWDWGDGSETLLTRSASRPISLSWGSVESKFDDVSTRSARRSGRAGDSRP